MQKDIVDLKNRKGERDDRPSVTQAKLMKDIEGLQSQVNEMRDQLKGQNEDNAPLVSLKQDIDFLQEQIDSEDIDEVREDIKNMKETIETTVPYIQDVASMRREIDLLRKQAENLTTVQTEVQILAEAVTAHDNSSEELQALQREVHNIKSKSDSGSTLSTTDLEELVDRKMAEMKKIVTQEVTMSVLDLLDRKMVGLIKEVKQDIVQDISVVLTEKMRALENIPGYKKSDSVIEIMEEEVVEITPQKRESSPGREDKLGNEHPTSEKGRAHARTLSPRPSPQRPTAFCVADELRPEERR